MKNQGNNRLHLMKNQGNMTIEVVKNQGNPTNQSGKIFATDHSPAVSGTIFPPDPFAENL
jgi:hypothetical protein